MRVSGCDLAVKRNKYLSTDCLRVYAYCIRGTETPCNLFLIDYYRFDKTCNGADGSKEFVVQSTCNKVRHCPNTYRVPQVRGQIRDNIKKELKHAMPQQYLNELLIKQDKNNEHKDWVVSVQTLKNIRHELLTEDRKYKDSMLDELFGMWNAEQILPENMTNGEFKYMKRFCAGPLMIILNSTDQNKITLKERERSETCGHLRAPRFAGEIDATGGLTRGLGRRIQYAYAIVISVGIPGDHSAKTQFAIAEMITNDHSAKNMSMFLQHWKQEFRRHVGYVHWPPIQGIILRII